jgi:hypothetical protein
MFKKKTQRIIAGVIVVILVITMVVTGVLSVLSL